MSSFIEKSNLPSGKVTSLICGGLNEEIISFLKSRDIEIFFTSENNLVDNSLSRHCDLSALYLGEGEIILDRAQKMLEAQLKESGFKVFMSEKNVEGKYPFDCILNYTIIGDCIVGKKEIIDECVREKTQSFKHICVKQGYCKCSVLVVDEKSVITDDESIYRALILEGVDCLLISKGDILLEGHEYGFIGGASGKLSEDEVIFFGDIASHKDFDAIKAFLDKRKIKILSFDFPLTDFGGIVSLKVNNL